MLSPALADTEQAFVDKAKELNVDLKKLSRADSQKIIDNMNPKYEGEYDHIDIFKTSDGLQYVVLLVNEKGEVFMSGRMGIRSYENIFGQPV